MLTTNVPAAVADKQLIHERYKDLAYGERGFRVSKTGYLELRPIYVRSEESTRGHVLIVMLAYLIRRELERAWTAINVTGEEGLDALKPVCVMEVDVGNGRHVQQIPEPREQSGVLLEALSISLPPFLVQRPVEVATRRTLPSRRLND